MRKLLPIIFVFIAAIVSAQELPPIQNYSPQDYRADNQNWGISQSGSGFIYIANNAGLLEFNGESWQLFPSPNGSTIRSVTVIDERIYTGSYMDFGFWEKDEHQRLIYNSLAEQLNVELVEDEQFWKITSLDDWVIFQSLNRLYLYNRTTGKLEIQEGSFFRIGVFRIGNSVYYQNADQGIFTLVKGNSTLVISDPIIKQTTVVGMYGSEKDLLIITDNGSFYSWDGQKLTAWNNKNNDLPDEMVIFGSTRLIDGSFILGTISDGLLHLDESGNLIDHISQEKGLQNNTVLSLFEDRDRNIWVGCDNGLSVLNNFSRFREYKDRIGKLGVVYTSIRSNGYLYLGTNQGLFYRMAGVDEEFRLIEGTQGQVWSLTEHYDELFCGHNLGTFLITGKTAEHIFDSDGTWELERIYANPELLLQGNYRGLSILEKKNGEWGYRNKIDGFDNSSRFVEISEDQQILVNHEFKGVFIIKTDSLFRDVIEIKQEPSKGIGSSLLNFNNSLLYATANGVFRYRAMDHQFLADSLLSRHFYPEDDPVVGVLNVDPVNNRLMGFTQRNLVYVTPGYINEDLQSFRIPISEDIRINMGVSGFENITHLGNEVYLIGLSDGYVTVDLKHEVEKEYYVQLSTIARKEVDTPGELVSVTSNGKFTPRENNIEFNYTVPEFDKYAEVTYQYKLGGYNENWSPWSKDPQITFINLRHGAYDFEVRAKVGNILTANTARYSFVITRPWYATNLAWILYILGFISLSYFIHSRYKKYYRQKAKNIELANKKRLKQKKLQAQKRIAQLKNENLRTEVKNKSRELAISTMSLIRKNEFLNRIKDQLKEVQPSSEIRNVIQSIDMNLNNEDDWKFFEEAFNNADKDFLKKIKKRHPDLTANDLRLCAYLRLNLSSKEIAPLLNISVRSVEVKRYRLRKKMTLPHEKGLIAYILEV